MINSTLTVRGEVFRGNIADSKGDNAAPVACDGQFTDTRRALVGGGAIIRTFGMDNVVVTVESCTFDNNTGAKRTNKRDGCTLLVFGSVVKFVFRWLLSTLTLLHWYPFQTGVVCMSTLPPLSLRMLLQIH